MAKTLADQGVKQVYGPMEGIYNGFFHVLPKYGSGLVTTRDERAAVYMAHARSSYWRAGVTFATAGPGVTDALTGASNAHSY